VEFSSLSHIEFLENDYFILGRRDHYIRCIARIWRSLSGIKRITK